MATSSRLDCSLDQLIDQTIESRHANNNAQLKDRRTPHRTGGVLRTVRRVVEVPSSDPAFEKVASARHQPQQVRRTTMKRQQQTQAPSQRMSPQCKLTPAEAAIHVSTIRKEENGDVVLSFKNTDVLKALAATGDLILNSGGFRTFSTRAILCAALQPVGLRIDGDSSKDEEQSDNWTLSDGRAFLQKFEDNMTVLPTGRLSRAQILARPSVIHQFMLQKKAGLTKKAGRAHYHRAHQEGGALLRNQEQFLGQQDLHASPPEDAMI